MATGTKHLGSVDPTLNPRLFMPCQLECLLGYSTLPGQMSEGAVLWEHLPLKIGRTVRGQTKITISVWMASAMEASCPRKG